MQEGARTDSVTHAARAASGGAGFIRTGRAAGTAAPVRAAKDAIGGIVVAVCPGGSGHALESFATARRPRRVQHERNVL